ncbi:type II secretion system protein, partial [Staphylococcus aureus]
MAITRARFPGGRRARRSGFTMLELVIVIGLMAVFVAIVAPN